MYWEAQRASAVIAPNILDLVMYAIKSNELDKGWIFTLKMLVTEDNHDEKRVTSNSLYWNSHKL